MGTLGAMLQLGFAQSGVYSTSGKGLYQNDIIWLTWDHTIVMNGGSVDWVL